MNERNPQLAETPEADLLPPAACETPFEHIALAFSGGGFRAASFSLGVLSYFDHLTFPDHTAAGVDPHTSDAASLAGSATSSLLQKIRFISSASGGTITNAAFALAV